MKSAAPSYLERRGRPLHPEDLKQHNCLRYVHPEGDPRWHLVRGKERHSLLPTGNLVSDHSELLLEATVAGLGIADFEIWLVRDYLASGRLQAVLPHYRMENALTGRHIYLAYLANRRGSTKLRVLRDFIADQLQHVGKFSDEELRRIQGEDS